MGAATARPPCRATSAATYPMRRTLRSRSSAENPRPADSSRRTTSPSSRVTSRPSLDEPVAQRAGDRRLAGPGESGEQHDSAVPGLHAFQLEHNGRRVRRPEAHVHDRQPVRLGDDRQQLVGPRRDRNRHDDRPRREVGQDREARADQGVRAEDAPSSMPDKRRERDRRRGRERQCPQPSEARRRRPERRAPQASHRVDASAG